MCVHILPPCGCKIGFGGVHVPPISPRVLRFALLVQRVASLSPLRGILKSGIHVCICVSSAHNHNLDFAKLGGNWMK